MDMDPSVNVVIGTNRFADVSIEVRAGDQIGVRSSAQRTLIGSRSAAM